MIGHGGYQWFAEELKRRVEDKRAEIAAELGSGMAGDFAEYRHGVGRIEGLRLAAEIAEEIKKEMDI